MSVLLITILKNDEIPLRASDTQLDGLYEKLRVRNGMRGGSIQGNPE